MNVPLGLAAILLTGAFLTNSACSPTLSHVEKSDSVDPDLILDGPLRATGPLPPFTLDSEVRILPRPMSPVGMSSANLEKNTIAITIDDGPSAQYNDFVLKTLRDHGVKATFFMVGSNVDSHPEIVANVLREGHSVGDHTWTHPQMDKISSEQQIQEIDKTWAALMQISQKVGIPIQPFFRFPYGEGFKDPSLLKLLQARGLANFFWSMTTKDSQTQDPDVALNTAVNQLDKYNRGIFLMHETHVAGVKSLPYFLYELKKRNYKTVVFKAGPAPK